ncbi:uncharacterized protein LOC114304582, partial [Camellia sinensis]|uniref:uncharacterized protein LOC114304582 n=1 Tax=Camellia sinensis TaxID=4442 RepID=UPI001035FA0A
MVSNFGFGEKWLGWIKECLSSSRISVLVNGSPTEEFSPQRGLRQGDPLSPFLFYLVAEGLNLLLNRAKMLGLVKGALIGSNGMSISHLQFADNTIIFSEADLKELLLIKRILRGVNPRRKSAWQPVVDKVRKRLSLWKRKMLSFAGRLTLIKAVVAYLPSDYISIFKIPKGVAKTIDKLQAMFLWGSSEVKRKVHLVTWQELIKPKSK